MYVNLVWLKYCSCEVDVHLPYKVKFIYIKAICYILLYFMW